MTKEGLKSIMDNEGWGFTLRYMAMLKYVKLSKGK